MEYIKPMANLLTELLQVGHHAVAQTVLHVLSQEVWRSHDPQGLSEGLREQHHLLASFSKRRSNPNYSESTYPDIIRRHGLQVALKGLSPFQGRLELVHFDQVIYNNEVTHIITSSIISII